jgi:hypothetical protein
MRLFGLSPKFSTPVEKTVENRLEQLEIHRLWPEMWDSTVAGEGVGKAKISRSR